VLHAWFSTVLEPEAVAHHSPLEQFGLVHINPIVALISIGMVFLGLIPGYYIYIKQKISATDMIRNSSALAGLHSFLTNRWYINAFYYKVFIYGVIRVCGGIYRWIEQGIIDRFNFGVLRGGTGLSQGVRKVQTGVFSINMIYMVVALLLIAVLLIFI
jgi:NADH:ubiquinone oxidoreductase subunit 5 (subunit L)/multisubunit Na+/H+ antiporter MnhA subunit